MEIREEKISITLDELCRVRKMGQYQLEQYLTEAMQLGYRQGQADRKAEVETKLRRAVKENDKRWQKAVKNAVGGMKGIGRKRKELLTEYLKIELEQEAICRR